MGRPHVQANAYFLHYTHKYLSALRYLDAFKTVRMHSQISASLNVCELAKISTGSLSAFTS